jgi:hypothetical protein
VGGRMVRLKGFNLAKKGRGLTADEEGVVD